MTVTIRTERPTDVAAITAVTSAAFAKAPYAGRTEALIITALRTAGQLAVSLVADDNGAIVGHVAVSPVTMSSGSDGWYGLGPIAVAPQRQGQGIGTQLVEHALAELRRRDAAGCVVLGEPQFYGRFGFATQPGLVLPDVPPEYFQILALHGTVPHGTVSYHAAFTAAG